jgi:hypothetical protein
MPIARGLLAVTLATAAAAAFAQSDPVTDTTFAAPVPERFARFEMTWAAPAKENLSARVRALAEVLVERPVRTAIVVPVPVPDPGRRGAGAAGRVHLRMADAPALEAIYLPEFNELRVTDQELAQAIAPDRAIDREDAVDRARQVFKKLAERGLVDASDFDWDRIDTAYTWAGAGPVGSTETGKRLVDYRFTLRRQINGIEFANAGVRIVIHASGRLSSLRLGGAQVLSRRGTAAEEPLRRGKWVAARATPEELRATFLRQLPAGAEPSIAYARVMYVMPEWKRAAVVEPLYVVSYALRVPDDQGETVVSRRRTLGLSLTDPSARPVDLMPPMRKPQAGDRNKRTG